MKERTRRWLIYGIATGVVVGAVSRLLSEARHRREVLARHIHRETGNALRSLPVAARSEFLTAGNVRLHVVHAGPEGGPLALLLHGFPENWYSWRQQLPLLVEMGYHVVIVDQRGYNLSEKPLGVTSYAIERLVGDVRDLLEVLGYERAVIVGHDWGGVVAWRFALDFPQRVERLVILNAPHPAAFARELRSSWQQRLKSWYALFFQLPVLPELLLGFSPHATATLFFRHMVEREGAFTDRDLVYMATALAQPGALRAMLNWYRAALRRFASRPSGVIATPTLLIWAEDDPALSRDLTYDLTGWVPKLRLTYVLNCGHWVQNEAPDEVNGALWHFLRSASETGIPAAGEGG